MAAVYRYDRDVLQIRILIVFIPNSSLLKKVISRQAIQDKATINNVMTYRFYNENKRERSDCKRNAL